MKRSLHEIELKRLLVCTEELLASESVLNGNQFTQRTFRAYVEELQKKLAHLEDWAREEADRQLLESDSVNKTFLSSRTSPNSSKINKFDYAKDRLNLTLSIFPLRLPTTEELREYKRKVRSLAELLPPKQSTLLFSDGLQLKNLVIAQNENLNAEEKLRELSIRGKVKQEAEERLRNELFGDENDSNVNSKNGREKRAKEKESDEQDDGAGVGLHLSHKNKNEEVIKKRENVKEGRRALIRGKALDAVLQRDEEERERMTDDMVIIAQELKRIHMQTTEQLNEDSKNLGVLDSVLDSNVQSTTQRKKAVDELLDASWTNTWIYWSVVLFVSFSFMGMFVFMKIFPR